MASLLKGLSAVLVVAGAVSGAYLYVEDQHPELLGPHPFKLRPVIDQAVGQGEVAVVMFAESIKAAQANRAASSHRIQEARLPFIVIEPRDFAAPIIKPAITAPLVTPLQA